MNKTKNLHWHILIALILAVIFGLKTDHQTVIFGFKLYDAYNLIGNLFLNGLRMLSIPLILTSIISGMASLETDKDVGKIGVLSLSYYFITTSIAIALGLIIINILAPGYDIASHGLDKLGEQKKLNDLFNHVDSSKGYLSNVLYELLPSNIFEAAAKGRLLGVITFGLLFGYFILHTKEKHKKILADFWTASFEVIMLFTMWFLKFTPIGVFGLVAKSVADTGFSGFWPLMKFFIAVLVALGVHSIIILSLFLYYIGKIKPWAHFKTMLPAVFTAFSTSSSSASLPITMECVEKNAGVSNKISSFILPLGSHLNMNGTALYEGMAAIFIAQAYGVHVGLDKQFLVLVLALITSIGVAGIPSASIVAITIILSSIGLPLEGIGLIMVTDRILDMCRTAVNIYGDSCAVVIVASRMGENVLSLRNPKK